MPRFRFRLQTLEKLREAARDACREQLADALRVDDQLRLQIEEHQESLRLARELQTVVAGRIDVDKLLEAQRYEAAVVLELRHVERQRAQLLEEVERRRAALVEADREVKTLEKLKEARRAEFLRAEATAEAKILDEIAGRAVAEVER